MTAGNNPREFVRLLKILYKANGLPTFIIPEEVFNAPGSTPTTDPVEDADSTSDDDDSATAMQTSDPVRVPTAHKTLPPVTPTPATVPVTNHDITVNAATLSDILSAPAPYVSPAAAVPSPVSVTNSAAIDPWCDPIEGTYYAAPFCCSTYHCYSTSKNSTFKTSTFKYSTFKNSTPACQNPCSSLI
ncbi:uncharacterized protein [Procambarus clarkii]|uniref:uncharacterized protein n=1 Tax=Procambarus clarkii TaxID=6728 RepID=UPI0037437CB8